MLKKVGVLALLLSAGSVFLPATANAQNWRGRDGYHYNDNRDRNRWRNEEHREHERREWREQERREERWRDRNAWRDQRYYNGYYNNGYYSQPGFGLYYSTPDPRCPY